MQLLKQYRQEVTMGQSYRELIAWQKAMDFVLNIYRASKLFPRDEVYGLAAQLRRAAVAIPAHIAEGQARYSGADFYPSSDEREAHWSK